MFLIFLVLRRMVPELFSIFNFNPAEEIFLPDQATITWNLYHYTV